jgi:hypothetical protein
VIDTPMPCANDRPGTAMTTSASNSQPSKRATRREVIFITSIVASAHSPEGVVLLSSRSNRELRLFPMPVRLDLVVLGTVDADSCGIEFRQENLHSLTL